MPFSELSTVTVTKCNVNMMILGLCMAVIMQYIRIGDIEYPKLKVRRAAWCRKKVGLQNAYRGEKSLTGCVLIRSMYRQTLFIPCL